MDTIDLVEWVQGFLKHKYTNTEALRHTDFEFENILKKRTYSDFFRTSKIA